MRERGIAFRGLRRVAGNPSLTLRVMINPSVSARVNNLNAETRNFKTRQREIGAWQRNPPLTFRVVISCRSKNGMLFRDCFFVAE
jgi:hypothetical protein